MDSSDPIWPSIVKFAVVVLVASFWMLLAIYLVVWFVARFVA